MKNTANISFQLTGLPLETAPYLVVWAHGWGMNKAAFEPFTQAFSTRCAHLLIDFPGFGLSPAPDPNWGTADYADALAGLIKELHAKQKIIFVGHSFGCRVGIQVAARHPECVSGLFLIAGAGLPRRRTLFQKAKMWSKIYLFKFLKKLAPVIGMSVLSLRLKFGSADYRSAGPLREIFVRVVRENLTEQAKRVRLPTEFVYGAADTETPPEIGERFQALIPHSTLVVLPGQDHYSVLASGRHIIIKRLLDFMAKV